MLRWRLFGIQFCIEPSFWLMNALWAMLMAGALTNNAAHDRFLIVFILVWIVCALIIVMVHELGHVGTGRIFGLPGVVRLTGLGGNTVGGYEELRPWQRIIVIMAGPCAGFALAAVLLAFDGTPWNRFMDHLWSASNWEFFDSLKVKTFWVEHSPFSDIWRNPRHSYFFAYTTALNILMFLNLFLNILNLFPIIPMDGGMILKEICILIAPRQGLKIAFGLSLVLALGMAAFYLVLTLEHYRVMDRWLSIYYPFGFPEFSLIVFLSLAYQCWQAYRQLLAVERHSLYMERD